MECNVQATPRGEFFWTINDKTATNGKRIDIETSYDDRSKTQTSKLNLTDASWPDTGEAYAIFYLL